MYRMERDVVHCKDHPLVFRIWDRVTAVAFERKVAPVTANENQGNITTTNLRVVFFFHISVD